ncbi:neutral ceramidase 2 [Cannabis sativa]|uniref:neutral ceramidase 2 n=1 Tax=Cannabis sativa TaxID=3483 RepID=UPI0029CAAA74|nr:neutral ceramidase 2 [Cannabis sativa]
MIRVSNGEYLIGVGSYDMTGPAAGVNMMGYANIYQTTAGVHFRLRARTFIVADEDSQGPRFAFVNLDSGMASQLVTIKLLERIKSRYGNLYREENVAISGIHTHSGPGGYLQYLVYSVTSLGFVQQSFDAIVNAIEQSLIQAHENLKPGSIFINQGDVEKGGINRSPSAYLLNPEEERGRYKSNVDSLMTLLKFVDSASGKSLGSFNWFPTHGTSMTKNNRLISGDNKGAAARFFEDWFADSTTNKSLSTTPNIGKIVEKAHRIKATGGRLCGETTSKGFKVRKNDGSLFVGAFCQSNVGDVTPNVLGAFCTDTGKPCDFNHSSCNGDNQICLGRGPGYPDEILSTKIIGERQFQKAVDLFTSATEQVSGKIDYRHVYLNFTNIEVELDNSNNNNVVHTCPAALGPGFAAGTTDGPGFAGFQQGDKEISEKWRKERDILKKPSQYQVDCQHPKPILLDTGEMFDPYAWAPAIIPIQMLRLGNLIILAVPGEFTTMAGRRLREAVKETLISYGRGEFEDDTRVVIAGLSNTYSQYIATFEEYTQQRYEASSTLYGPHTLSAYLQEFKKLAKAMATGETISKGPSPPDLSTIQRRAQIGPFGDSPPSGVKFGDMKEDIKVPKRGFFKRGDHENRPYATFWSANPSYDLLTEGTFAVVETLIQGQGWIPAYDDDDFSLFFKYKLDESGLYSLANIEWDIPDDVMLGVYRLRHFGSSRKEKDSPIVYFTGASSAFAVLS